MATCRCSNSCFLVEGKACFHYHALLPLPLRLGASLGQFLEFRLDYFCIRLSVSRSSEWLCLELIWTSIDQAVAILLGGRFGGR